MKRVIKILALVALFVGIAYLVVTVIGNFVIPSDTSAKNVYPDVKQAKYAFTVQSTGELVFTNDYEVYGTKIGKRFFMLHGYFERSGQTFKFRDRDYPLDENIYGPIDVKERSLRKES